MWCAFRGETKTTRRKQDQQYENYSSDRLRLLRLQCAVSAAVRGRTGEREEKDQASSNRRSLVVTGDAPGPGARSDSGTTHPLLNLTSIIRMPDSASNRKMVLVRGQRSSPFVETSMDRRIFPGFFQRPDRGQRPASRETAGEKNQRRASRETCSSRRCTTEPVRAPCGPGAASWRDVEVS